MTAAVTIVVSGGGNVVRGRVPDELKRLAFAADNGELAWYRDDALQVIQWATVKPSDCSAQKSGLQRTPGPRYQHHVSMP